MLKNRIIIQSILGQHFHYYGPKWGLFNIEMLFFDGWKYDGESYREFHIIRAKEGIFLFLEFSEYIGSEIVGGIEFDVDDDIENSKYIFFDKKGKRFGNKEIGYYWSNWDINKHNLSAKNYKNDIWYELYFDGTFKEEPDD